MAVHIREREASLLGLDPEALAHLGAAHGPLAVVDLETTGLSEDPHAELLEFGAVLVDATATRFATASVMLRPRRAVPAAVLRLTGITLEEIARGEPLEAVRTDLRDALLGRTLIAHNAAFERHFLTKYLDPALADALYLDTLDLLSLTHPDAPDLRLESFTRMMFASEEAHRALDDAVDTARVISRAGAGARAGEARYVNAARALERFAPESPWLALLGKESLVAPPEPPSPYVVVGETTEKRVPFDPDAIAQVLGDAERGRRHFPGYRVRAEQIALARRFATNLRDDEVLLLEGGTGVGKSLAYLAAAIPYAVENENDGYPLLISTRTKLLQDQLLTKDIGAAARFLGYPELRVLSIKGRANYACQRRLEAALAAGSEPRIFLEDRMAYAALLACARTRPHGEIGTVPGALLRRFPMLRDLLRSSVAARSEQCTRDQCAGERDCPFGRRRAALAKAHLVIANHDLLLRWPSDYPNFVHAIVDEVHELADVADEVYALEVSPDELLDRFDEVFGRPGTRRSRGSTGMLGGRLDRADVIAWRRALAQDLQALGRSLEPQAGDFGEVHVPDPPGPGFAPAAKLADAASARIDDVADRVERIAGERDEPDAALGRAVSDFRGASEALRLAFSEAVPDAVAAFGRIERPFDRWRLAVHQVTPADAFHEGFLGRLSSFAGVSASVFIGGDAFAALGQLQIEARAGERLQRDAVPSPFPYASHMRVVALRGGADLVAETAAAIETLALPLGGRTLALFTSLQRMYAVAEEISPRLREAGIEVLTPRRASDDPQALVRRFQAGNAVLLGARKFWQGLDIPGDRLQAVVIEKLPFEVPTELRRRREQRLEEQGIRSFGRYTLGKMLLNLKQMCGRLIRSEEDRGLVVIVEARTDKGYFPRVREALPEGARLVVARLDELPSLLKEVGIHPPN